MKGVRWDEGEGPCVWSGGDDGALKGWDMRSSTSSPAVRVAFEGGGVTSINTMRNTNTSLLVGLEDGIIQSHHITIPPYHQSFIPSFLFINRVIRSYHHSYSLIGSYDHTTIPIH